MPNYGGEGFFKIFLDSVCFNTFDSTLFFSFYFEIIRNQLIF